ncbi:MAG TPA: glycosyl hydrolase, partial [Rhizobium sp.]|nr:glycosyl hydrolase [Rhizobium sp.]
MNAHTALPPETVSGRMTGEILESKHFPGRFEAFLPSPCVQNHAANLAFL